MLLNYLLYFLASCFLINLLNEKIIIFKSFTVFLKVSLLQINNALYCKYWLVNNFLQIRDKQNFIASTLYSLITSCGINYHLEFFRFIKNLM